MLPAAEWGPLALPSTLTSTGAVTLALAQILALALTNSSPDQL